MSSKELRRVMKLRRAVTQALNDLDPTPDRSLSSAMRIGMRVAGWSEDRPLETYVAAMVAVQAMIWVYYGRATGNPADVPGWLQATAKEMGLSYCND